MSNYNSSDVNVRWCQAVVDSKSKCAISQFNPNVYALNKGSCDAGNGTCD